MFSLPARDWSPLRVYSLPARDWSPLRVCSLPIRPKVFVGLNTDIKPLLSRSTTGEFNMPPPNFSDCRLRLVGARRRRQVVRCVRRLHPDRRMRAEAAP
eukprot:1196391-Prorocentrum_minimum.AAC.3